MDLSGFFERSLDSEAGRKVHSGAHPKKAPWTPSSVPAPLE